MAAISSTFVKNKLLPRVDLVDLVGQYCKTQKSGSNYKCLCPFHEDHNPSMIINPHTQRFKCYACGAYGDALDFMRRYFHLGFIEAVEKLASQVGLSVDYENIPYKTQSEDNFSSSATCQLERAKQWPMTAQHSAPEIEQKQEPESLDPEKERRCYELMERVGEFFCLQLRHNRRAQLYLQQRQISPEVAAAAGLGYAPESRYYLQELCHNEHELKLALELGLERYDQMALEFGAPPAATAAAADAGDSAYSALAGRNPEAAGQGRGSHAFFRQRLMIPLRNLQGRIVAFGARCIGDGEQGPKYLNSPESAIFKKHCELFGLYECLQAYGGKIPQIVVVEGYMDVITLRQAGLQNVVAALGTALSREHFKILQRYTGEIVLCFDGDGAGGEATFRALKLIAPELTPSSRVRALRLPKSDDPDSLVRTQGLETFKAMLAAAPDFKESLVQIVLEHSASTTTAIKETLQIIASVRNLHLQQEILQTLAHTLNLSIIQLYIIGSSSAAAAPAAAASASGRA